MTHPSHARPADPLAAFADRDRAVRDRIATIRHRSYTKPAYYPTYLDEAVDHLDALRAHYDLLGEMKLHVPTGGPLESVLNDAAFLAYQEWQEQEKHLATLRAAVQTAAYATYRDNLAVA